MFVFDVLKESEDKTIELLIFVGLSIYRLALGLVWSYDHIHLDSTSSMMTSEAVRSFTTSTMTESDLFTLF